MKQLSAETTWKRVQAEVSRQRDLIQRLYQRRILVYQQVIQFQEKIQTLVEKKKSALSSEDYTAAEAAHTQEVGIKQKLEKLFVTEVDDLDQAIHQSWKDMEGIVFRESEAATALAEACRESKEDRQNQLIKFNIDTERMHEKALQKINSERADIDKEKSEIAFEVEMWEQSNAEFRDSLNDIAHDERVKKDELTAKMDQVQVEIDELTMRLGNLRRQYEDYKSEITQLENVIENATSEFAPEKDHYTSEWRIIQQRKDDVDARATRLDEEDADIQRQMKRQTQDKARGQADLEALEERMKFVSDRANDGKKGLENLSRVFMDIVETRDQLVSSKKLELSRARHRLAEFSRSTDSMQTKTVAAQQRLEEIDESAAHMKSQLVGLERQKKVAAEMGQFQRAAKVAAHIKTIALSLDKSDETRQYQQSQVEANEAAMHSQMEEFEKIKRDFEQLEHQTGMDILSILEKSKIELAETDLSLELIPQLKLLIDNELRSLDLNIESTRCRLKLSEPTQMTVDHTLFKDDEGDNDDQYHTNDVSL
ncbi:hypothetical protein DFQ28_006767 [Apophysomyces sp. BC1034]|nr:hypothetical protein DFQ29_003077 [Apophysomyces sp. BC1021]KAG0193026.1 hypothetical protein DFQ28_006767 [Apophysomyces sp. BC1034]